MNDYQTYEEALNKFDKRIKKAGPSLMRNLPYLEKKMYVMTKSFTIKDWKSIRDERYYQVCAEWNKRIKFAANSHERYSLELDLARYKCKAIENYIQNQNTKQ